jgi:hypothetical protein
MGLYADSVKLMRSCFGEAEKLSARLSEGTAELLPMEQRLTLATQGINQH